MYYNVEIDVSNILPQVLKEDYLMLKKEIKFLSNLPEIAPFQKEDLNDCKRWVDAMAIVLTYYLPYEEAKSFLEEN